MNVSEIMKPKLSISVTLRPDVLLALFKDYVEREHPNFKVTGVDYNVTSGNYNSSLSLRSVELSLEQK